MSEDKKEDCVFDADKINNQLNELNKIYNEGVDHCIEVVKNKNPAIDLIPFDELGISKEKFIPIVQYLFNVDMSNLINELLELKKPI